ncbi:unnamed protein product [Allacma fusca]|uniref:RING-type domain-containing protein n=1 Tax=Allacma fusca TaxID=39272 RepID=A0A8J2LK78_9HEXA|nr:unnamed protein product [Allacma fusca]
MKRATPGGSAMDSSLDVTSVHCQTGCGSIFQQVQSNSKFYFTSCGHMICANCKVSAGVVCPVCGVPLKVMEFSSSMEPNIKLFFEDPVQRLGQELFRSVSEKINKLRNVIKFQKTQRLSFNKLCVQQLEENKKLRGENARLQEKVKELYDKNQVLEMRLQQELEKRSRPTAVVTPDVTKRALFQPGSGTPRNAGQFGTQANFRTPMVTESHKQRMVDTPFPNTPIQKGPISQLCSLSRPVFSTFEATRANVSLSQSLGQQQRQQQTNANCGMGAFRSSWAAKPAASKNWSPSSVSSFNYNRRF